VLSFLTSLNGTCKQLTKHTRYAYLKALFNFIRDSLDTQLQNPCDTPMLKKLFRRWLNGKSPIICWSRQLLQK
jgi:hypothetical protein